MIVALGELRSTTMDTSRLTFEFTVDEAVDVQIASLKMSREAASWRRREQVKFVFALTVLFAVLLVLASDDQSVAVSAFLVAFAFVVSLLLAVPFGWYYDHLLRSRTRRFLIEQLGGAGPYRCSMEIRPDNLWVAQSGIELAFPWNEATGVQEAPEGITITFRGGRVLARSRGFTSDDHRSNFLGRLRELVPPTALSPPAA